MNMFYLILGANVVNDDCLDNKNINGIYDIKK